MPIKPETAQQLLVLGKISNEFYDTLTSNQGAKQNTAIADTAAPAKEQLKAADRNADDVIADADAQIKEQKANSTLQASNAPLASQQPAMTSDKTDLPPDAVGPNKPMRPGNETHSISPSADAEPVHLGSLSEPDATYGIAGVNAAPKYYDTNGDVHTVGVDNVRATSATDGKPGAVVNKTPEYAGNLDGVPYIKPSEQPVKKPAGGASSGSGTPGLYKGEVQRQKEQNEMYAARGVLNDQTTKTNQQIADEQYQIRVAAQDEQAKALQEEAALQAKNQADHDREMADVRAKYDEIYNTKIDPDKYWHDKSTGNKILSSFAILLGGLGQGLQQAGGNKNATNGAMDNINRAIDRDIDAQQANLKTKFGATQGKEGLLNSQDRYNLNSAEGRARARGERLTLAEMKLGTVVSKYGSEKAQQAGQELQLKLADEKSANDASISALAQKRIAAANAASAAAQRKQRDDLIKLTGGDISVLRDPKTGAQPTAAEVYADPGKYVRMSDPKAEGSASEGKIDEAQVATDDIKRLLGEMKKIVTKRSSGQTLTADDKEDFEKASTAYAKAKAKQLGPNATQKEIENEMDNAPQLDSFLTASAKSLSGLGVNQTRQLERLEADADEHNEAVRRAYGSKSSKSSSSSSKPDLKPNK